MTPQEIKVQTRPLPVFFFWHFFSSVSVLTSQRSMDGIVHVKLVDRFVDLPALVQNALQICHHVMRQNFRNLTEAERCLKPPGQPGQLNGSTLSAFAWIASSALCRLSME